MEENQKNLKHTEFTRQSDDACYLLQKDLGNAKRLKYMTTDTRDSQFVTEGKVNFFGMSSTVAAPFKQEVDTDMKFAKLTNCGDRTALGPFPLNGPSLGVIGSDVRFFGEPSRERGACTPVITDYQERTFTPFINIEVPDPMRSVYTSGPQSGISTRAQNRVVPEKPASFDASNVDPVSCERIRKFNRCQ